MTRNRQLKVLTESLYISHSQISTYLACSLKYRFRYVEKRERERLSIALPMGTAIHSAVERHYNTLMAKGAAEDPKILKDLFAENLLAQVSGAAVPVVYKKQTPDLGSVLEMGQQMIDAFCGAPESSIDPEKILDVELPLSARLLDADGRDTGFNLIGIIDLLIAGGTGEPVVVDHKTAAAGKSQADVNADLQLTAYSYLLSSNGYVLPRATVGCHMGVLRKLKKPKLEVFRTDRTAADRNAFAKIATAVLAGIDAGVFIPTRSWMCIDCEYADTCRQWLAK